jgi:alcohol dehydrogenase class IV
MGAEATQQWTAKFNPREPTEADFVRLYEAAL